MHLRDHYTVVIENVTLVFSAKELAERELENAHRAYAERGWLAVKAATYPREPWGTFEQYLADRRRQNLYNLRVNPPRV